MRQSPLLLAILAALGGCDDSFKDTGCMTVPVEQTTCAKPGDVDTSDLYLPGKCGDDLEIVEILGNGERQEIVGQSGEASPSCCYPVDVVDHDSGSECAVGRPYYDGGVARRAPLRSASEQAGFAESARAQAWALAGAAEHASVAAFSRLALELMALGAPNDLLRGVHQAALDEVGHADLCWALAERLGGSPVGAAEFPLGTITLASSLAALAAAAVREGCLGETLGAHVATAAAELATEPDVKAALRAIAAEEVTHAVLSFRIVAWALRCGGEDVKIAVREALAAPWPKLDLKELALRSNVSVARLEMAAEQGVTEVLEPATARLLAA